MGKDIPLGRIAGIKVGMHVTVFLTAGLYTVVAATSWFPQQVGGESTTAYWIAGGVVAFFIFISILIHEIGHALVARDEGIEVESMSLTLLGGVTRMRSAPTTPGAEFRVSVVGPIASATCGVVFLAGAYLLPDDGIWALAGATFLWAGAINLLLAAINMIPGAPLDGGKVLSSAIWRATNNQFRAQAWSAGIGIVLGMVMITVGFRMLGDDNPNAYLVMILGAFIAFSAFQQLQSAPLYRALEGQTVSQAMMADPPSAPAWTSISDFLRTAQPSGDHQAYPVVSADGQVSGVLTASAIRALPPHEWDRLTVSELAYPLDRLTIVRPDDLILTALQMVDTGDVRIGLVVADDGHIVGIVDSGTMQRAMENRPASVGV